MVTAQQRGLNLRIRGRHGGEHPRTTMGMEVARGLATWLSELRVGRRGSPLAQLESADAFEAERNRDPDEPAKTVASSAQPKGVSDESNVLGGAVEAI